MEEKELSCCLCKQSGTCGLLALLLEKIEGTKLAEITKELAKVCKEYEPIF